MEFDEIYRKYYDMIYRYINRAIHNNPMEAEDLTQEVFWVAFQKWDEVEHHPNIGGFLMVVAKNKVKKWLFRRSLVYYNEEEMIEVLAEKLDEHDPYDLVEVFSAIEETLSHEELTILLQYYGFGYSAAEMSERLGIEQSCFKVRVLRMREKLKKCIELVLLLFVFCASYYLIR